MSEDVEHYLLSLLDVVHIPQAPSLEVSLLVGLKVHLKVQDPTQRPLDFKHANTNQWAIAKFQLSFCMFLLISFFVDT